MIEMAELKQELESLRKNDRENKFEVNKVSKDNQILSQTVVQLTKDFGEQGKKIESYCKTIDLLNLKLQERNDVGEKKPESNFEFNIGSSRKKKLDVSQIKREFDNIEARPNDNDNNGVRSDNLFDQSSMKRNIQFYESSSMPDESLDNFEMIR